MEKLSPTIVLFGMFGFNVFSKDEARLALYEKMPPEYLERKWDRRVEAERKRKGVLNRSPDKRETKDKAMSASRLIVLWTMRNQIVSGYAIVEDGKYKWIRAPRSAKQS